jgi:hypothetical protein
MVTISALSGSVNSTDSQSLRDDISTTLRDDRLVVYALTPNGRSFLRQRFGATTRTVELPSSISPFDLATLCSEHGVRLDFDPLHDETIGGDE